MEDGDQGEVDDWKQGDVRREVDSWREVDHLSEVDGWMEVDDRIEVDECVHQVRRLRRCGRLQLRFYQISITARAQ